MRTTLNFCYANGFGPTRYYFCHAMLVTTFPLLLLCRLYWATISILSFLMADVMQVFGQLDVVGKKFLILL